MVAPLRSPKRPLTADLDAAWIWRTTEPAVRVYHEHPDRPPEALRTWGPVARFDPHVRDRHGKPREQADGRGIVYVADNLGCALAEATPDQPHEVLICPAMRAVQLQPRHPTFLLDLTDDGAMRIGAVGTLAWGDEPRRLTQRWGRAIHEDLTDFAGIRYRSAHQGGLAIAYWGSGRLAAVPGTDVALSDATMLGRVKVELSKQGRVLTLVDRADCERCAEAAAAAAASVRVTRTFHVTRTASGVALTSLAAP